MNPVDNAAPSFCKIHFSITLPLRMPSRWSLFRFSDQTAIRLFHTCYISADFILIDSDILTVMKVTFQPAVSGCLVNTGRNKTALQKGGPVIRSTASSLRSVNRRVFCGILMCSLLADSAFS